MLVDQMRSNAAVGRMMRLSKLGKEAVAESQATALEVEGRARSSTGEEQSWDSSSWQRGSSSSRNMNDIRGWCRRSRGGRQRRNRGSCIRGWSRIGGIG